LSLASILSFSTISEAWADSSTPAKVLSSKSVFGQRTIVYTNGNTESSGDLWSAKIPTKVKMKTELKSLTGTIPIKFRPLIQGEDLDRLRIEVQLWTVSGKKVSDRTLYDWSPVSPTTTMDFLIFISDKIKAGKYIWVIITSDNRYSGEGTLKIPVTLS
jgi:hypothetical protein